MFSLQIIKRYSLCGMVLLPVGTLYYRLLLLTLAHSALHCVSLS